MSEEERKSYEILYEKIMFVDKYRMLKPHWIKFHNYIEKLKKENEELKEKVFKRDKELIKLEEYANKNFERKDDVKAKYIPKDKIREIATKLNKETDWLFEEEGSWSYCEPFRDIAKELEELSKEV